MPRLLAAVALLLSALLLVPAGASAQDGLDQRTLYETGPSGRYLMGGKWLFRFDEGRGLREGFAKQTTTDNWAPIGVPYAWNATDESEASFMGTAGWYRKDFRLPSASRRHFWIVRFESVNYRARVYLNGQLIGKNTGAYLPFELRLPAGKLKRTGTNRLVIRAENKRLGTDFPPAGLSVAGRPTGGWWNYGGLLREVYLRKVDGIDVNTAIVRADLPCASCDAAMNYRVTLRNYSLRSQRVSVTAKLGQRTVRMGGATLGPKRFATFRRRVMLRNPRLWSPATPRLYDVSVTVRSGRRVLQRYTLRTGVRSIKVSNGRLVLNGSNLNFRGFGLHEDSKDKGFAISNAERDLQLSWVQESGATLIRSHYPLHPHYHEEADRRGLLVWSEVPVYAVKTQYLKSRLVRELAARLQQKNILFNGSHPSIIVWSVGNELSARPGPVQGAYLRRAAQAARELDPSRPVGYAVAGYPSAGCQPEYAPLDIIGINEYFGWYPGPNGQIADRTLLGEYLDSVRQCYPDKAIVISEFGAEANRDGPVEEKGTFQHQQDFVNYHLGVYASRPWLSGSVYWALQEFRVRPGWEGGNPRPNSPVHEKGVVRFDGSKKPAFFDLQREFRAARQIGAARRR
jgi:beta-galactosidase/beta-glucuronidase